MKILKWFSGGNDRSEQAILIIANLLNDLSSDHKDNSLQLILNNFKNELEKKESSVPLILSRMNVEIANTIQKNSIILSDYQSNELKKLRAISNIRYGY